MFALVLLGFLAIVSTAAWYDPYDYNNGFQDRNVRFWENFGRKMNDLGKKIENVVKHSKNRGSTSLIDGDEYKIAIYLTGFNKEDIVVNARKGNLVIQAIHNVPGEPANTYMYAGNLPDFVDENGSWSYNNGILIIVFPIKQFKSEDTTLPYVNNENDQSIGKEDSAENVIGGYLDNSYDTEKFQTTSDPSEYDYEDANQPSEIDDENS